MSAIRFEATTKNVIKKDLLCPIQKHDCVLNFPFIYAIDRHIHMYLPERVIKKSFHLYRFILLLYFIGIFLLSLLF